ncbi:MAG: hypothetical protein JRN08_03550 [Nitrososphaerota archaeon]|nr:hypothetical protein [Nitrososphaerota archaeon]
MYLPELVRFDVPLSSALSRMADDGRELPAGAFEELSSRITSEGADPEKVAESLERAIMDLGRGESRALLFYISQFGHVGPDQLPQKLEAAFYALGQILGPGAQVIERRALDYLASELPVRVEEAHGLQGERRRR